MYLCVSLCIMLYLTDSSNFGNETYIDIQIVTLYLYLFLVNFWLNLGVWLRGYRGKKEGSNRRTTMQKTPFGRSVRILCKDKEYYADWQLSRLLFADVIFKRGIPPKAGASNTIFTSHREFLFFHFPLCQKNIVVVYKFTVYTY